MNFIISLFNRFNVKLNDGIKFLQYLHLQPPLVLVNASFIKLDMSLNRQTVNGFNDYSPWADGTETILRLDRKRKTCLLGPRSEGAL